MKQLWLTDEEADFIKRRREAHVAVSLSSTDLSGAKKCKYLRYDAEGAHCSIHEGEGVGEYCKWKYGEDCRYGEAIEVPKTFKCDCCGKEVEKVFTVSSGITAMTFSYCKDCLLSCAEPYDVLISTFAGVDFKKDQLGPHWERVIEESLKIAGKTRQDFEKDCNDFMEKCKHWGDNPW